jgi:hypothetical protein
MKRTALEMALERKNSPCEQCEKLTRVNNALFCGESGKLLMPMYLPGWNKKCFGTEEHENDNR